MEIKSIKIVNYKRIKKLEIKNLENACILIGKNSVGKTAILDAILVACGQKETVLRNFASDGSNIEITLNLYISGDDLAFFHRRGLVNRFKNYELFYEDFLKKYPSYRADEDGDGGTLEFTYIANRDGRVRYYDGINKDNSNISLILPKVYYIDHNRNIEEIEQDILGVQLKEESTQLLKENRCMFDESKSCNACFQCIGRIEQKPAASLTVFETEKLLEYKMLHALSESFIERLNKYFRTYSNLNKTLVSHIDIDLLNMMKPQIVSYEDGSEVFESTSNMSDGMKSIYILSLLETYMQENEKIPCILMMEDPEMFLHPSLQKTAGEILY